MASLARSARLATRAQASRRAYSVVVDAPPAQWVAKREEIKEHAKGPLIPFSPCTIEY